MTYPTMEMYEAVHAEMTALRAEVERLTALLQEAVSDPRRNVLGDDWWKLAKAALESKQHRHNRLK